MKKEKIKKTILLIAGPGVLLVEAVALFIHLFTSASTTPWLIGGAIVFFVVFIPLYSIEYFRQEFKRDKDRDIRFRRKNTRMDWHGGNIHGKVPKEEKRPGRMFNS